MMTSARTGVLLLGNHAPPYGGVPNHLGHLARHLSSEGWDVHVMSDTSTRRGSYMVDGYWVHAPTVRQKLRNLLRRPPRPRNSRLFGKEHGTWRSQLADIARANLARSLVLRYDLDVIGAYHLLKPGISAAWVSEDTGRPLVTTVFGEIFDKPALHRDRLPDVRYILETSDARLSCSKHCSESAEAVLGLNHRIDVLHYGVDTERFVAREPTAAELTRYGLEPDDKVIVYVARLVEEMGLGTLLDAAPRLLASDPAVRLIIAGAYGPLHGRAVRMAEETSGRVQVYTDVPDAELPSLYSIADVVAAPSSNSRACLGLAIAEAMASGRPVVACAVGGTGEVVEDGVTGKLVPPSSPDLLADALLDYLSDTGARQWAGQAGRARAEVRFDVRSTNTKMEGILRGLLQARSASGPA
jgi:glycosyltransferase involved in cell wall biosynthesis